MSGFVLILLILGVALVWAVLWGPLRDVPLITGQPANRAQEASPAPEKAAQDTPPAKALRGPGSRKGNAATDPAAGAVPPPEQSPAAPAPSSPPPQPLKFPTSADIPLGMQGSRIVAAFGQPIARTIGVDQGGQIEIFIYRRGDPDTATFIHLRNGRVISASTTLY